MDATDLDWALARVEFAGILIGGSLPWKLATGADCTRSARARGLRVHIGRAGTAHRVAWARRIGADSIDSCAPLWSRANLARFLCALRQEPLPLIEPVEAV